MLCGALHPRTVAPRSLLRRISCKASAVARAAAREVGPAGHVIGIDLKPGMIRVARSLPAPNGAPIEWFERSALDLGVENASVDAVLCQQRLQFFPDKAAAIGEMYRVLRRGAERLFRTVD